MIASDAIALVVNKENKASLITLDEIKGIVTGKITRWEQLSNHTKSGELKLVFDASGSSTVRYMKDSLCNGKDLKGNVYASEGKSNQSVLDMVQANPNIIGIVGANWLMDKTGNALADPRSQSQLKNFFFYAKGQKGQTIICNNSQMLPITPVQVKDVSIKD